MKLSQLTTKPSELTFDRALLRLQPNIIVSKLSQAAISRTITPLTSFDSNIRPTRLCGTQQSGPIPITPQSARKQTRIDSLQSWRAFNLLGEIKYEKRNFSISERSIGQHGRVKGQEEFIAVYRAPRWLMDRAWRIEASRASSGWIFCPRTCNIISHGSIVFNYAAANDTKGLQKLFSKREASPFDCNESGLTLLHVGIYPELKDE